MVTAKKTAEPTVTPGSQGLDLDALGIVQYPPTVILTEGQYFTGQFKRITAGPENAYGIPYVVEFTATGGMGTTNDGEVFTLVPGTVYSFWLLHTVIRTAFAEGRPEPGENIAVVSFGKAFSKDRKDKDGNPVEYTNEQLGFPDRPQVDDSISWDVLAS